jgi:hypothetical protein
MSHGLSCGFAGFVSGRESVARSLHTHCIGFSPEAELPQNAPHGAVGSVPGGDAEGGTRLATLSWTMVPPWNPKRTASEVREQ